ncbi:multidrug transporter [Pseudomonas sp. LS1212]|uniref:multidrug transporter n=1 Tax=Pseudomonas sp. LS1212 TaxID=2972478 RepID=UPI00215D3E75|nr:multidrug transporter [Pseudomonas sp. LS1212]UVJ44891.1 multidrug transporter [Pseudomonas sp. LS1212]
MFIGVLLVLTWFVLLLRYPAKAFPVSLAALFGLGLVALWVVWLDNREASQLARLELRLSYAPSSSNPQRCPADRPLLVQLNNGNDVPLLELRWRVAAYAPGDTVNLAENIYAAPRYRGPGELQAGASWEDCLPLPPLRPGYRPQTLEFRAERLQGSFSD